MTAQKSASINFTAPAKLLMRRTNVHNRIEAGFFYDRVACE